MSADEQQATEFGEVFRAFLTWVTQDVDRYQHPITTLLRGHLGEGTEQSVLTVGLPALEHVNLQVALEAWLAEDGRSCVVQGLAVPEHFGGVGLHQLLHGEQLHQFRLSAPEVVDLAAGRDRTLACWTGVLLLVSDARGQYVVFVRGPSRHEPSLALEIGGLETAQAQQVLKDLAALRNSLSVYRGQILEIQANHSGLRIVFPDLPPTERDDVVLPEAVLRRVERHTLDVARQRDQLLAAGRHLKRGLLLYGPPGTGKTHTTRYVVQHLPHTTVLLLAGASLHAVGQVVDLARALAPAAVVLEDVDLVAEDRGFGPGSSPVLFELLDAMDGSAADADLLFLLTTNRADVLEPALATRPGRVDVAVEIGLPDADARARLLQVHGKGLTLSVTSADLASVVEQTEGVTASFLKELLRRAVLEALEETGSADVSSAALFRALEDLLDSTQGLTRALLGVPSDQAPVPLGAPMRHRGRHVSFAAGPSVSYGSE